MGHDGGVPSPSVVLLDLDGTLTDSAPGILAGVRHALDVVGAPQPAPEVLQRVIGPPLRDTFGTLLGLAPEQVEPAMAAYLQRYDERGWAENAVYDGVPELLATVRGAGLRMAVATSKNERFAARIVEHFGLAPYLELVAGASDDGHRRAKADVVERALRGLGLDPAPGATPDVVMVGDREHDVDGAGVWGIPTALVGWGYGSAAEHARARWSVPDTASLAALLVPGR